MTLGYPGSGTQSFHDHSWMSFGWTVLNQHYQIWLENSLSSGGFIHILETCFLDVTNVPAQRELSLSDAKELTGDPHRHSLYRNTLTGTSGSLFRKADRVWSEEGGVIKFFKEMQYLMGFIYAGTLCARNCAWNQKEQACSTWQRAWGSCSGGGLQCAGAWGCACPGGLSPESPVRVSEAQGMGGAGGRWETTQGQTTPGSDADPGAQTLQQDGAALPRGRLDHGEVSNHQETVLAVQGREQVHEGAFCRQ